MPTDAVAADEWVAVRPPPLSPTPNPLPPWASTQPDFPFLPGEDTSRSRSIGDASDGWLVNAVALPVPSETMRRLDGHRARGLDFTTQEMVSIVSSAAAHVAAAYPSTVLYLGNFSLDGGGDIPYSVSHNSGRDGDLAFFMLDARGQVAEPTDLLGFDAQGKAKGADGATYTFDVKRNWKLVEGLILADARQIQFVFVSTPLRRKLLAEAKRVKAKPEVVKEAERILSQPGGALPHDDHFHVRLYCSPDDVASGCIDQGTAGPDIGSAAKASATKLALDHIAAAEADLRLAAVRRLQLLRHSAAAPAIVKTLSDPDPRVRAAAARALAALRVDEGAVAKRVAQESDPHVSAELVWALSEYGSSAATDALTALLDKPRPVKLDDGPPVDLRALVADVLSVTEDPRPVPALIELTRAEDQEVRLRANRALKMLTNQDPASAPKPSLHDAWAGWWKANGKKNRDAWLLAGFQRFGVKSLSLRYVWELTYPVLEDDHLSYNAQRTLMRLAKRDAPSLEWAKTDANFYWRRWFERRCPRLGCPKVPRELTTLP